MASAPNESELRAALHMGFGPGTMVLTRDGEVPVEWLDSSHELLTRDNGFQPLVGIRRTRATRSQLNALPSLCMRRICAGSIEPGLPRHDVYVSPSQLVLIRSVQAQLDYWSNEVLVEADVIAAETTDPATHDGYVFTQLLMSPHQLIQIEGLWLGSTLAPDAMSEIESVRKSVFGKFGIPKNKACRPVLDHNEALALLTECMTQVTLDGILPEQRDSA